MATPPWGPLFLTCLIDNQLTHHRSFLWAADPPEWPTCPLCCVCHCLISGAVRQGLKVQVWVLLYSFPFRISESDPQLPQASTRQGLRSPIMNAAASVHVCLQSPYISVVFHRAYSNWSVQSLLNLFQASANRMLSQLDFQNFHCKYRNPGVGMHTEVSVCGTVYFLRVTKTRDQKGDSTPTRENWMWADYVVISPAQADVCCPVLPTVILFNGREGQVHFSLSFLHFLSTI